MNKSSRVIISVIVIVLVVWGVSVANKKGDAGRTKIGVITALTGSAGVATYGEPLKKGLDLALREVDPEGKRYELVFEDYMLDTKQALPAYTKLKSEGVKVFIVDGSPALSVLAPEIRKDGYLAMNPTSFIPSYKDGNPLTCRMALTADSYGPAYADLLINKLKIKKAVALIPNFEAGVALIDAVRSAYEKAGGQILGTEMYAKDATDFKTNIEKLKAFKDADAIFVVNYFNSATPMFKQMQILGLNKKVISDDWTLTIIDKALVEGAYYVGYDFSLTSPASEKGKKYFTDHSLAYGSTPLMNSVVGYDMMSILDEAFRNASTTDAQGLSYYMINSMGAYDGVGGRIAFNSDCEVERDIIFGTIKNGKAELIGK